MANDLLPAVPVVDASDARVDAGSAAGALPAVGPSGRAKAGPHGPVALGSERVGFVDSARAAGIVLVVLGHAWPDDALATRMIYGFHMPLFFFLSGAVLKDATLELALPAYVAKQARSLVVPYLFFALVSALVLALRRASGLAGETIADASWSDILRIIAAGSGREIRIVNSTLWFFTALFTVSLYYYAARRVLGRYAVLFASSAAAYALLKLRPADAPVLPWNLDVAVVCLPFYALGAVLARNDLVRNGAARANHLRIEPMPAVAALAAGLALAAINTVRVDLRDCVVGDVDLFLPAACLGVCGVAVLAARVPPAPFIRRLAEAGIAIFPLHIFVLIALAILGRKLGPADPSPAVRMGAGLLAAATAVYVCLPIYDLLKRYVPAAVGGRKSPASPTRPTS